MYMGALGSAGANQEQCRILMYYFNESVDLGCQGLDIVCTQSIAYRIISKTDSYYCKESD